MKKIILVAMVASSMLTSCLTSLHPLVSAANVIADNRVIGTWVTDDDTIKIIKFLESEPYAGFQKLASVKDMMKEKNPSLNLEDSIMFSKGYSVSYKKNGVEYFLFGAITRINNELYIDLVPVISDDPKNQSQEGFEYSTDYLPTLTMAKLEIRSNNSLAIHFVNGDYIKDQIKSGNMRIKHEQSTLFETFMVTASSAELEQFFGKYGNDERLFNKENSVTLTRKG